MHRPLLLIQIGEPPEAVQETQGQQSDWFVRALSLKKDDFIIVRPDLGEVLPDANIVSATIVTGSWRMVTEPDISVEYTAKWLRKAHQQNHPLLGVCYGHHLLSYALGGKVGYNPAGTEQGLHLLKLISVTDDILLKDIPVHFSAWLSHQQTVLSLPDGAKALAFSAMDKFQVIRYSFTSYSLQFHPEFTWDIMIECIINSGNIPLTEDGIFQPVWPMVILKRFYFLYCSSINSSCIH